MGVVAVTVQRHKTALGRNLLSRPVARAIEDGVITGITSVLDYGCGRGGDVERLRKQGVNCEGYDPVYRPQAVDTAADVTNLGYVVNVIEDQAERAEVLRRAWSLTRRVLIISARLENEARDLRATEHLDGYLTSAGTFQKFFSQTSLRAFIQTTLDREAIAAAPGVFYVFRSEIDEQGFLARRVRRTLPTRSRVLLDEHAELMAPLIEFVEERGRLPRGGELVEFARLEELVGSVRNAFAVIRRVTGDDRWDRVRLSRSDDLLVYIALSRFGRRPRIGALPSDLQYDIKDFFGSYKAGCSQADSLLFAVADQERISEALRLARVGKLTREALYIHTSAVGDLVPVLRVLDGCARAVLGLIDEATLVKFRRDRPLISYLSYPHFDRIPHPELQSAYTVDLRSLRSDYRDYRGLANPPILHRKELFVAPNYPARRRFSQLTQAEVRAGLYADPERIGTREGWRDTLTSRGVELRGHRLRRVAP